MLKESKAEYNYKWAHYTVATYMPDGTICAVGLFPDLKSAYEYIARDTRLYPGMAYQIRNALGLSH